MAKLKSKPKVEEKPAAKPIHRFKLDDFRGGQIAGVLCIEAFKDRSLLDPVRKWVAEGKLVFAAGDSDVLDGMLFLADEKPTPAKDDEDPKQSDVGYSAPRVDLRNAAIKRWDSWPEGWQRFPLKCPPTMVGTAGRVMEKILGGAAVSVRTNYGIEEVRVSPDGAAARVWWDMKSGQTVTVGFSWDEIERAIQTGKPLEMK